MFCDIRYDKTIIFEQGQLFQHLVSIKILHVFNHLVSVTKLRVIGHLVSVTKLHVFNHSESVTKLHEGSTRVVRKVRGLSQYNLTDMSEIIETRI
jgi:hypothetical protein